MSASVPTRTSPTSPPSGPTSSSSSTSGATICCCICSSSRSSRCRARGSSTWRCSSGARCRHRPTTWKGSRAGAGRPSTRSSTHVEQAPLDARAIDAPASACGPGHRQDRRAAVARGSRDDRSIPSPVHPGRRRPPVSVDRPAAAEPLPYVSRAAARRPTPRARRSNYLADGGVVPVSEIAAGARSRDSGRRRSQRIARARGDWLAAPPEAASACRPSTRRTSSSTSSATGGSSGS